jgi:hypothetical protein
MFGVCNLMLFGLVGWLTAAAFERIDADETGIRWRTWRGVKRIAWDEVSDYYKLPPMGQGKRLVVETGQGIIRIPSDWVDLGAFQNLVRTFAADAFPEDWAVLGCRAVEPKPLVFGYSARWSFVPVLISTALAMLAGIGMRPHGRMDIDLIARYAGPGWALCVMAFLWIIPTLALSLLAIAYARIAADTRRRKSDTITVTQEGISFTNGAKEVAAKWEEVTRWGLRHESSAGRMARMSVETARGNFDVTLPLRRFFLLAAILRCRCGERETRQDIESLARDLTGWNRGSITVNGTVHHYRTRSNRILMLAPLALLAGFIATDLATRSLNLPKAAPDDDIMPLVLGASFFAYLVWAAWLVWRYRCDAIVVNDEGITKFSARGIRSIAWPEVESYRYSGSGAVLCGGGTTIVFSETISGFADLFRTIEKRAVNSRNTMWNTVPKGYGLDDLPTADRPENRSPSK